GGSSGWPCGYSFRPAAIRASAFCASRRRGATACSSRCSALHSFILPGWVSLDPTFGGPLPCRSSTPSACFDTFREEKRPALPRRLYGATWLRSMGGNEMRRHLLVSTAAVALLFGMTSAHADMEAAKKFLDEEIGDLSALDRAAQEAEMEWFINAAQPFQGMDIK